MFQSIPSPNGICSGPMSSIVDGVQVEPGLCLQGLMIQCGRQRRAKRLRRHGTETLSFTWEFKGLSSEKDIVEESTPVSASDYMHKVSSLGLEISTEMIVSRGMGAYISKLNTAPCNPSLSLPH